MATEEQVTIKNLNSGWLCPYGPWAEVLLLVLVLCLALAGSRASARADDSDKSIEERRQMVNRQIKARGIVDAEVLRAMSTVPRHLFVPKHLRLQAYADRPLPIGHGQTISQPYIVAYMTEILQIQPQHRVLEIGTGSGYQAAILGELSEWVYTMEIIQELADTTSKKLKETGYNRLNTRQGDGYHGWPEAGPFDAIMVTAAAEFIPPPLLQQLKEGGRMIIPVGSPFHVQHLMLVKKDQGTITTRSMMPVRFVPFRRSQ